VTTLQNFEASCVAWLGNKEPPDAQFAELLTTAFEVLVGTRQRDIAAQLKMNESTVSRWVKGSTCPHPLIQNKVIRDLLRRTRSARPQSVSGSASGSFPIPMAAKS